MAWHCCFVWFNPRSRESWSLELGWDSEALRRTSLGAGSQLFTEAENRFDIHVCVSPSDVIFADTTSLVRWMFLSVCTCMRDNRPLLAALDGSGRFDCEQRHIGWQNPTVMITPFPEKSNQPARSHAGHYIWCCFLCRWWLSLSPPTAALCVAGLFFECTCALQPRTGALPACIWRCFSLQ